MTRRQAFLALLALPQSTTTISRPRDGWQLDLRARVLAYNLDSFMEIEVSYQGQTRRFTAQDVWDALSSKEQ